MKIFQSFSISRKRLKVIGFLILLLFCLIQLGRNLSRGYILIPPFELASPPVMETFHSTIEDISINYPSDWRVWESPRGNHGDTEIISLIKPFGHHYPYVTIAHIAMPEPSLEEVAKWGEARIKSDDDRSLSYESYYLDEIDIDTRPALLRTYSHMSTDFPFIESQRINCYHTYVLDEAEAYIIEMCVSEEFYTEQLRGVFEQMIKSISFVRSS